MVSRSSASVLGTFARTGLNAYLLYVSIPKNPTG